MIFPPIWRVLTIFSPGQHRQASFHFNSGHRISRSGLPLYAEGFHHEQEQACLPMVHFCE
jgi:hypothetical protein